MRQTCTIWSINRQALRRSVTSAKQRLCFDRSTAILTCRERINRPQSVSAFLTSLPSASKSIAGTRPAERRGHHRTGHKVKQITIELDPARTHTCVVENHVDRGADENTSEKVGCLASIDSSGIFTRRRPKSVQRTICEASGPSRTYL